MADDDMDIRHIKPYLKPCVFPDTVPLANGKATTPAFNLVNCRPRKTAGAAFAEWRILTRAAFHAVCPPDPNLPGA